MRQDPRARQNRLLVFVVVVIAAGVLLSVFGGGDDPSGEAPGTPPQHAVDR
ncbi:MAG: hypothetical protein ACU0DT_04235 [Albimonas sp.]|uniref:hypothetical protein n=1 Tax=Albimonas sp. TaxID=1872425 RepID=UPI0040575081|tara:strand:- start:147 stop:299 length:153 start_codon:yes stop_codon:yes gene_type:complete